MEFSVGNEKITIEDSKIDQSCSNIRYQLNEYIDSKRTEFELTIFYPDSFTGKVMKTLSEIPYGETRTYGDIARKINSSPVAVGQACRKNPVPIIIPCHRVLGYDSLGGYRFGLSAKKKLLDLESANLDNS
jgi:methylated-DNA-[protein]-cysteine S-methyltransferase